MNDYEKELQRLDEKLGGYSDWLTRRYPSPSIFNMTIEGQQHTINELLDRRNDVAFELGLQAISAESEYGTQ